MILKATIGCLILHLVVVLRLTWHYRIFSRWTRCIISFFRNIIICWWLLANIGCLDLLVRPLAPLIWHWLVSDHLILTLLTFLQRLLLLFIGQTPIIVFVSVKYVRFLERDRFYLADSFCLSLVCVWIRRGRRLIQFLGGYCLLHRFGFKDWLGIPIDRHGVSFGVFKLGFTIPAKIDTGLLAWKANTHNRILSALWTFYAIVLW